MYNSSISDNRLKQKKFKIILAGDSGVGKSSLIFRFVRGYYDENILTTIGVAYSSESIWLDQISTNVSLDLWDTAGQERFDAIIPRYFRGCQGIVILFDPLCYQSVESVRKRWLYKIKTYSLSDNPIVVIVANKSDLLDLEEVKRTNCIIEDLAEKYRKELKLPVLTYLASAKTGENVSKIFEDIALRIYKQYNCLSINTEIIFENDKETNCCL